MVEEGRLLTCYQSVEKLVAVLEHNSFVSGVHLDYYDVQNYAEELAVLTAAI